MKTDPEPADMGVNDSLLIHMFCINWEREIVFVLICRTARTIYGLKLEQNTKINKKFVFKF
jgi:hypothetical protein